MAPRSAFNRQGYTEAVTGPLIRRSVAFYAVEWSEFSDLAVACNWTIKDLLITERKQAKRHIDENYELYRKQLKESIGSALSKIHISTDLLTCPNCCGVLPVYCQWVDHNFK